jgi:hypothetical protein
MDETLAEPAGRVRAFCAGSVPRQAGLRTGTPLEARKLGEEHARADQSGTHRGDHRAPRRS